MTTVRMSATFSPSRTRNHGAIQYRESEELLEVRLTIEARARLREDIDRLNTAVRKREALDGFVRLTWRFRLGMTVNSGSVAPAGTSR